MSRRSVTHFDVILEGEQKALREASKGAFQEVQTTSAAAGRDQNKLGVVFCQLELTGKGYLRLRGAFIEPEWATKIADVLIERAEKSSPQRMERAEDATKERG